MRALVLVTLTVLLGPPLARAQSVRAPLAAGPSADSTRPQVRGWRERDGTVRACLPCADPRHVSDWFAASRRDRKSPALAGLMSLVVPGLGSFYAGHVGHGVRHLVAVPVIVGATAVALVAADQDGGEIDTGELLALFGGALALTANGIWSVATAVSDANRSNARPAPGASSMRAHRPRRRLVLRVRIPF